MEEEEHSSNFNWKLLNDILDIFITLGTSIIFVIVSPYINSIAYTLVAIGYLIFISFSWITDLRNWMKKRNQLSIDAKIQASPILNN